jgi:flagellar assembly factor FliW
MLVNTSRFGPVEVDDSRVITFPKGLLGFPTHKQYVLIQPSGDGYFFWLQSVDTAELAFVVTDPSLFVSDYQVPMKTEQMEELGLSSLEEAQVFVIVNKRGSVLTGNLQGPLVIHTARKSGEQLVLADRRFHTRVPLLDLGGGVSAASA